MKLHFLGRGAAFNPKEGNTSAYFIENNNLFLIDCGESTFSRLITLNTFKNIKVVYLMITHLHSDHVGSIGSLIDYCQYVLKIPVYIILKEGIKYFPKLQNLLDALGIDKEKYNIVIETELDNKFQTFNTIRFVETKHSNYLNSYSIIFDTLDGIVYYSGDTNEIDTLVNLISNENRFSRAYVDTTTEQSEVHLNIEILNTNIPSSLHHKIYCMHINNDECLTKIGEYGFNVVEVEK